jgi:hypothetical protein
MNRTEFFEKLLALIASSGSNYQHGRIPIGRKKLAEARDHIDIYLKQTEPTQDPRIPRY